MAVLMLEKLEGVQAKYDELTQQLSDPEVTSDPDRYRRLAKAHAGLSDVVEKYRQYREVSDELDGTRALLEEQLDPEMQQLAEEERDHLSVKLAELEEELRILLLPKDPNDEKGVIVEIRAGAGGEEAALFAANLSRMYLRYAEERRWRSELMSQNETELGGLKEVIFSIDGPGAFSRLKFESGVHRVQRVPETESSGRIHTSTATVAVLPEAEDVELEIRPDDLRVDVYRSGGHGGQSVNTTDSAVRITHLPTGIVVACQDERSQLKNREKAMKVLRARLYDQMTAEQQAEMAEARKMQVGSGDRSERIRTYNFPQGRVSDHRIGLTLYHLDAFMAGALDEVIDRLIEVDQAERLQQVEEE